MNSDPENFDQLRRLLKLKRYEQPHPRYFNNFSSQVMERIKDGESTKEGNLLEWLGIRLESIHSFFENKTTVAWSITGAISAVVIGMVVFNEGGAPVVAEAPGVQVHSVLSAAQDSSGAIAFTPVTEAPAAAAVNTSSNEVGGSLFDQIRPSAMPASWQP